MFCPQCRSEYREGYTRCTDCGVDLVDELPDECEEKDPCQEDAEENAFVPVFSTHNPTDVATVQWLLEDAGIRHYFSGEHAARAKHPALSAILMVGRDRVEDAIELLKEFQSTWAGFSGFSPL